MNQKELERKPRTRLHAPITISLNNLQNKKNAKPDMVNLQITELPAINEKLFKLEKEQCFKNKPIETIQDFKK